MEELGRKYAESVRYGRIRLVRRRDNGYWYAKYRLQDSPRVEVSLHTTWRKDAEKQADYLNAQILNKTIGIADGTIPVDLLFSKFMEAKDGRVKPKTLKRLQTTVASFRQWQETKHPELRLARQLTPEIVRQFQSDRKDNGLSLRSVNNDIMNLHTVFRWAVRERLMARSPADYSKNGTVDRYKVPRFEADVYTEAEVAALIAAAETRGDTIARDIIIVLAGTGMRFEELAHLKPPYILWDLPKPKIEIRARKDWTPKDPTEVKLIPMLPAVKDVISRRCAECKSNDEYIFKNTVGRKLHVNRSRGRVQRLFGRVGIGDDRRLHQHSFRNYFIIYCLKRGAAVNAVMQWTGHDSEKMVLHYARAMKMADADAEFSKVSGA